MSAPLKPPRPRPRGSRTADLLAGLTVALVLVPQSMAYAQLAGMPPELGLIAGALPPIFAAFFASSPWLHTGPTAVTSILVFGALSPLAPPGSPEYVALGALLAGVVGVARLAIGLLHAGAISYLMSQAVLRGFTFAAALLIAGSQLPPMLGSPSLDGPIVRTTLQSLAAPWTWSWPAIAYSAATLAILQGSKRVHPLFPGVLVAVVLASLASAGLGYAGATVGEIATTWPSLSWQLPWHRLPELLLPGVVIAVVGFAEATSICQAFAESEHVPWDPDREFVGQGVANIVAGLFGSFPVGGSFSRSALNHLAGARTRWSGAITGLAALAILPLARHLEALPEAVLGAVIFASMFKLMTVAPLRELWPLSRVQFAVAIGTFVATLALSPRIELAVVLGVATSLALHLHREMAVDVQARRDGQALVLRPRGVLWFASAPTFRARLFEELDAHRDAREVTLDLSGLSRVDLTGALQLQAVVQRIEGDGTSCVIDGVGEGAARVLRRVMPGRVG